GGTPTEKSLIPSFQKGIGICFAMKRYRLAECHHGGYGSIRRSGYPMKPKDADDQLYSPEEATRRRDEAIRRAPSMLRTSRKEMVGRVRMTPTDRALSILSLLTSGKVSEAIEAAAQASTGGDPLHKLLGEALKAGFALAQSDANAEPPPAE